MVKPLTPWSALISHIMVSTKVKEVFKLKNNQKMFNSKNKTLVWMTEKDLEKYQRKE